MEKHNISFSERNKNWTAQTSTSITALTLQSNFTFGRHLTITKGGDVEESKIHLEEATGERRGEDQEKTRLDLGGLLMKLNYKTSQTWMKWKQHDNDINTHLVEPLCRLQSGNERTEDEKLTTVGLYNYLQFTN